MNLKDARGCELSGATPAAIDAYEAALAGFHCYSGDPFAHLTRALDAAPDFAMAHLMCAGLLLTSTEERHLPPAREALARGEASARNERERRHAVALAALAGGAYEGAMAHFAAILDACPRDVLALQLAHLFDFYRGDSRNLRDRPARVLPHWSERDPGYHALLGMLAFGREECGEYGAAEESGRHACAIEPRDGWAHHAVAHVMEMQGRADDGIEWMRSREPFWATDNFFAVHNWWHWALFHLERDEIAAVLALYDERIGSLEAPTVLDLVDGSALLWRLMLRNAAIGASRWSRLADAWSAFAADGIYAFNNVHALMALLGAGRNDRVAQTLAGLEAAAAGPGSNAAMAGQVGLPVGRALAAFAIGNYRACVSLLEPVPPIAHRFGGSHAQRDLLDLTLIEAAKRAGDRSRVRELAARRLAAKPASPIALRYRDFAREEAVA